MNRRGGIRGFVISFLMFLVFLWNMPAFSGEILNYPKFKAWDANGDPLAGGLLYTYEAGTTTAKSAYSDVDCSVAHTNPVVLDSNGEATIYLNDTYKLVLKDSAGVTLWTLDDVGTAATSSGSSISPGAYFYPDADATDQGLHGSSNTISYYIDTVGTTNKATIFLKHDSGSEWTDYAFSTSDDYSSNKNIKWIIENGARLDIGSGVIVALPSPENVIVDARQQWITGDGSVTFAEPGSVSVRWAMDGDPDGSTDYTAPMQMMIDALPDAGGDCIVPGYASAYVCNLSLPAYVKLMSVGYYTAQLTPETDASPVITVTGTRVYVSDITLAGNGAGTSAYGIRSSRADDGAAGGLVLERVKVSGFTIGFYVNNNYYNVFRDCRVQDVQYGLLGRNAFNDNKFEGVTKFSAFDYGIAVINDEDTDTYTSHANTFGVVSFESPHDYTEDETIDGKPAVAVYLYNVSGNVFPNTYFEGMASNNAWPVIEGGGPTAGVHGGGDDSAYLTDESGRDFTQLGVKVGMTVENLTDGSTGVITAIGDDAAKNDKLTMTLNGGSDDDWDNNDRFLIDIDSELTNGSKLRNCFSFPQFSNQADANRFIAGYNEIVSDVQGIWAGQKDGDIKFNKVIDYSLTQNTRYTVDLSSNLSAWAGYYIGKVKISYKFTEGGAGSGYIEILPVGGTQDDSYIYQQYDTSQTISANVEIGIDDNAKFQVFSTRAGTLSIRIHKVMVGS